MEDLCVLYADLESDHAGLVGGVCDHGRGGVAAVYERLYADDDVCGYAVYSGAFWRRVPKADAVGERAVSSYAVSGAVGDLLCGAVGDLLCAVGRAFSGVAGSDGDHICVWDRDDVHELQGMF